MSEAPERVWLDSDAEGQGQHTRCFGSPKYCSEPPIEYIRKDVSDALVAAAREEALREAAATAKGIADQYVGYMSGIEKAILALITKDAE